MAEKRITDFILRSNVSDSCELVTDDTIQTWRITAAQLLEYIKLGFGAKRTLTATDPLTGSDSIVLLDASGGDFTLSLPAVGSLPAGHMYFLKNISTGQVTLDGNSSELIDSSLTLVLYPGDEVTLFNGGTLWLALSLVRRHQSYSHGQQCGGNGSGNTCIPYFVNNEQGGSAILYTSDSTDGDSWTIQEDGLYSIGYSTSGQAPGITKNLNVGTYGATNINAIPIANILNAINNSTALYVGATARLEIGDIIRGHNNGTAGTASAYAEHFRITKIGD